MLLFAAALLAPSCALAQGSGGAPPSVGPGVGGPGGAALSSDSPFLVTKTIVVKLASTPKDDKVLSVLVDGKLNDAKLDPKVRIKADKGTEYSGKKKIAVSDLQAGMELKLTYRADNLVVVEIRILKMKEA